MSETPLQLPSSLQYGFVQGRIILAVADSNDADRLPDSTPAVGSITLTPVESKTVQVEAGSPVLVAKNPIAGSLDSQGRLRDSNGGLGLCVVTGQYYVTYSIVGLSIPTHEILVESTHTEENALQLANYTTSTSAPPLTPDQFTILSARIDALSQHLP